MDTSWPFIRGLILLVLGVGFLGWLLYYWLRHTREDPVRLIVKWVLSLLVIVFVLAPLGARLTTRGQGGAFLMVFVAVGGLMLALIWTPTIAGWVGSKFESLYTGGDTPPDPRPFYSIAMAHRKAGRFDVAIQETQKQLERFPGDVTGHFLLAEIQAEDLNDLTAAHNTLEMFCNQPGHQPQNVWLALNTMADWHLQFGQDVDAARRCLESILERLPDTAQALMASQRLGHLGTSEDLAKSRDRTPLHLRPGVSNIGLLKDSSGLRPQEEDPEVATAKLIDQLESHPLDTEAREKLAVMYATHYGDFGLARDQLEILIQQPNQPSKHVVRWLNHLAELQVNHGEAEAAIQATLQRIIDLDPNAAAADRARQRLAHVRLELKGKEKGRVVTLGTYEQNIGLKKDRRPDTR